MPIVYPDVGEVYLLRALVAPDPIADILPWHLRIFGNDYTPKRDSVLGNFTEASWTGYSALDLDQDEWQAVALVSGRAVVQWGTSPAAYVCTLGVGFAYGYYITDHADAVVLAAERFDSVQLVDSDNPLLFNLVMKLHSEYEPA